MRRHRPWETEQRSLPPVPAANSPGHPPPPSEAPPRRHHRRRIRPAASATTTRLIVPCLVATAAAASAAFAFVYVYDPTASSTTSIIGHFVQLLQRRLGRLIFRDDDNRGIATSAAVAAATAARRRHRRNPNPYIDASILLTGVAKDVDPATIHSLVPKLRKLGSYFRRYHIIVYENNSGRESKYAWRDAFRQQKQDDDGGPDYTFGSEDLSSQVLDRLPSRTDRIAHARNELLSLVHSTDFYDFDYVLVTDLDQVCGDADPNLSYSPSVLREAIIDRGAEWDGISFRHEPYFDLWAFRHPTIFPFNMHGPRKEENWKQDADQTTASHDAHGGGVMGWVRSLDDSRMYEVESAFMMMAIYRINVTVGVMYSGVGTHEGEEGAMDCEHVAFHGAMKSKHGARVRLWPVVYCQGAAMFREVNAAADSALVGRRIPAGNQTTARSEVRPNSGNLLGRKRRKQREPPQQQDAGKEETTFGGTTSASPPPPPPPQRVGAMESSRREGVEKDSGAGITLKNILWSRNWHNLVTCTSVPAQYYQSGTESRQSIENMLSYFGGCHAMGGGVLWVRLGVVGAYDVTIFIDHILPKMTEPFTLITTDGDNSIPGRCHNAAKLLDSPLLIGWYTQNCDGCVGEQSHDKLHPIPIGFDLHSMQPNRGNFFKSRMDTGQNMKRMLALRRAQGHGRNSTLLVPPWNSLHGPERRRVEELVQCAPHDRKQGRVSLWEMWELFARYRFGFSPPGAGIDCHRTWEMLFFGMVPIVKTGPLNPLYKGLPVIIVQDWGDVCKDGFLEEQYTHLPAPTPDRTFTLEHWLPRRS